MANAPTIAVIVGSLRKESINRKVAEAVAKAAGERARFEFIEIGDLDLYNQDKEAAWPERWTRLKNEVEAADAVLFVTPEYNRSFPGVLKNAIDIASRPWGKSSFAGKPAGVIGASIGKIGTAMAQQHLRNVLSYLDMRVLHQPEVYVQAGMDGSLDEGTLKFVGGDFTEAFLKWVDDHCKG